MLKQEEGQGEEKKWKFRDTIQTISFSGSCSLNFVEMIASINDATEQHWDNNQSYCNTELDAAGNSYSKHLGFMSIQGRIKQSKV